MTGETDRLAELVLEGARELDVELDSSQALRMAAFLALLDRWNAAVNLIAPCSLEQAVDRHIHDSLALLRLLDRPAVGTRASAWIDVGSGAGLPGLVLAMARPQLRITLVEVRDKKVAFLREALHRLDIPNVDVVADRLENLAPVPGGATLSRATFPPAIWAERGRHLVGPDGLVLVTMGGQAARTLVDQADQVDRVCLPLSGARRTNIVLARAAPGDARG